VDFHRITGGFAGCLFQELGKYVVTPS